MAKKIVKVNEEKIRGYMVGDIPDAIENEDIIVVEVPEEGNNERQDTEKETARKNSKSCNMPKSDSNFRQKYLVNTPMPGRIQVYLNRKLYDEIKNYLNVIAPEVSIASYICHPGHAPISAVRSFHRRQDSLKAADCRNWQTN